MDTKTRSVILQKARGTYLRNEQIRVLAKAGENYAAIGRMFKMTLQAIRKIVLSGDGQ